MKAERGELAMGRIKFALGLLILFVPVRNLQAQAPATFRVLCGVEQG